MFIRRKEYEDLVRTKNDLYAQLQKEKYGRCVNIHCLGDQTDSPFIKQSGGVYFTSDEEILSLAEKNLKLNAENEALRKELEFAKADVITVESMNVELINKLLANDKPRYIEAGITDKSYNEVRAIPTFESISNVDLEKKINQLEAEVEKQSSKLAKLTAVLDYKVDKETMVGQAAKSPFRI